VPDGRLSASLKRDFFDWANSETISVSRLAARSHKIVTAAIHRPVTHGLLGRGSIEFIVPRDRVRPGNGDSGQGDAGVCDYPKKAYRYIEEKFINSVETKSERGGMRIKGASPLEVRGDRKKTWRV